MPWSITAGWRILKEESVFSCSWNISGSDDNEDRFFWRWTASGDYTAHVNQVWII
jgi:hypothetical protein